MGISPLRAALGQIRGKKTAVRKTRAADRKKTDGSGALSRASASASTQEAARAAVAVRPEVVARVRENVARGAYLTDEAAAKTAAAMLEAFSE